MPFFTVSESNLALIKSTNFNAEKDLQTLIENNLDTVFNCRFIASEFYTGTEHAGRIDTLALSEDNNPVIIEYKKVESSELVNQSLYYLSWINDHRGDFQLAVNKKLGADVNVDWSEIRVICLAPGFKKFDLHAVKMMGANIELWKYRLLENGHLYITEEFRKSNFSYANKGNSDISQLSAGKKAALTRATGEYNVQQHLEDIDNDTKEIITELQDFTLSLDDSIAEIPKKFYIAYKSTQNFVCMQIRKRKVVLFLKIDPKEINPLPSICRDVTNIGHYGTGDFELTIKSKSDLTLAKQFIEQAYRNVGG